MSAKNEAQDFYQLTPDQVLDSLESIGLQPEAALLALNSYENRVYQFRDYDDNKFVVKFYRPNRWTNEQILEEHRFCFELAEAEIPVVAPIQNQGQSLFQYHQFRFAVFPCKGGRTPNLDDDDTLVWLGRFIGRIHLLGESNLFSQRPNISMQEFGFESVDYLLKNDFIPPHIFESYSILANQILEICQQKFSQVGHYEKLRLHGDCHPSNVLWTDDGPHYVDFDDSRNGPAVQDLWMLVTDNSDKHQWNKLLEGYEDFREFDDRELNLVEPLRALRMLNYSAWLARRWDDPSFKHNFPWFNTNRYWEEQVLSLKEQLAELQHTSSFNY